MAIFRYYSTCSLLVFLLVLSHPLSTAVENSTAITTRYPPRPLDTNRPSSVAYDYYGGEICVVLATSSTAVIEAPDPGNGQNFSINLPLDVPLNVRQGQRPCTHRNYFGGNCLSLVLFTSTSMLPLGRFMAFLGPNATTVNYGPLGFVTPDGTNTVIFSETQRNFRLIYRTLEQKELFTVCRNRTSMTGFFFGQPVSLENCQIGSISGFSIPFELNVHYSGLLSEVVGQQLIITTATCSDPESGLFVVLDVQSPTDTTSTTVPPVTPVDTPPPPTPSHPSTLLPTASIATSTSTTLTTAIMTTPTAQPTTSPPPGNSVALTAGITSTVALLLCVVGGIIIIVGMCRSKRMGNCHLAFVRSVSHRDGNNDADTLVEPGDSRSPAQQGTPEPNSKHIQDMIQGTEGAVEIEMSHTQINLHPSDDENASSVTHSPVETPTTTTTSGQSKPALTEQSKVTPTTTTGESNATPEKSGLSPNSSTSPSGGKTVVDGDSGDGVDLDSINTGPDSDSIIHKLDLSTTADEAGSSGRVTQSLSGEEGQVLENILTESPDLTTHDVEASIKYPNDPKKRAYSASHKDTKNPYEKLIPSAQSTKKELKGNGYQGKKSPYIDEEDTPEGVEKATSKVNQRPDRVSGGSVPVSKKEFMELQDAFQEMKDFFKKGNEDVVEAVKKQGAAISDKQNEHTAMLGVIAKTTTATREDMAKVKNYQEEMRDDQLASKVEDDQGQADEDYSELSEDCSNKNSHTD